MIDKIFELAQNDFKMADSEIPKGKIEDFVDSLLNTKIMKNQGCQTDSELLNPEETQLLETQRLVHELSGTIQNAMDESEMLIARVRSLEDQAEVLKQKSATLLGFHET